MLSDIFEPQSKFREHHNCVIGTFLAIQCSTGTTYNLWIHVRTNMKYGVTTLFVGNLSQFVCHSNNMLMCKQYIYKYSIVSSLLQWLDINVIPFAQIGADRVCVLSLFKLLQGSRQPRRYTVTKKNTCTEWKMLLQTDIFFHFYSFISL